METPTIREGLEEYARSLDLSLDEVMALLEDVFNGDSVMDTSA